MAKLVAFYSRADEDYFSGGCRYVTVGNTEKPAKMISEMTGTKQKIPCTGRCGTGTA
jgi:flavodoxin